MAETRRDAGSPRSARSRRSRQPLCL